MKRNLNSKVIATGLFNVADQNDDLDKVCLLYTSDAADE